MKLATRAKLKSVSKQFVDNLATRTHTHTHPHSVLVTRTAKTLFFAAHWRHLLPAYANSALNAYTHSLISLCLACSHSCTLSHSVSLSVMLTPTQHLVCCALLFRRQQQTRFGAIIKSGFFSLVCFVLSFSLNSLQVALPLPLSLLLPAVLGWLPWLSLRFSCRLLVATCGSVSGNSLWLPHSHSHSDSLALAFSYVSLSLPLSNCVVK